jgi:hypothetical protein
LNINQLLNAKILRHNAAYKRITASFLAYCIYGSVRKLPIKPVRTITIFKQLLLDIMEEKEFGLFVDLLILFQQKTELIAE